ncbi:uncharacterized protein LOC101745341 [Bombyx mori]|uniref:Uncharacterized protein n=1 Tax=Bombyx mori TaxID=7091 RepID=A0A8R1WL02_BOMMO|nr:uncharacterized protein LOC101745341 [Bombyx mori]
MLQAIIPVLVLATAALSSSNILPLLSKNQLETEPFDLNDLQNDNIFSSQFHNIKLPGSLYLSPQSEVQDDINLELKKSELQFPDPKNDEWLTNLNIINKKENYNDEGFRQEQWHNYPRQLDRLHKYLYEHYNVDKRSLDVNGQLEDEDREQQTLDEEPIYEAMANKADLNENIDGEYVRSADPMLKDIRFEYKDDVESAIVSETQPRKNERKDVNARLNIDLNPEIALLKDKLDKTENTENSMEENKVVAKRIFSLWSRLQGLNHNRGHELHHRRHLHAFYGLPDGDGGGVLTAETRATLMRPPGSPLRWG